MNKPPLPIETLDAAEVATLLRAGELLVIDVHESVEFQAERIAGALLYPLSTFDAAAIPEDGGAMAAWNAAGLTEVTLGSPG